MNIAIDGPAGAGKSTVARLIAEKLGILHLDTGAMYRAMGLFALQNGLNPMQERDAAQAAALCTVDVQYKAGKQITLLNGADVSGLIRTQEVSAAASAISAHRVVRTAMVALQRKIAAEQDMVLDGRDIGSNVLKDCKNKFFLTASVEERARRRRMELTNPPSMEQVLAEVMERDYNDSHRENDPLICAPDAVRIETDDITAQQAAEKIISMLV